MPLPEGGRTYTLTASFRLGPEVAHVANVILHKKLAERRWRSGSRAMYISETSYIPVNILKLSPQSVSSTPKISLPMILLYDWRLCRTVLGLGRGVAQVFMSRDQEAAAAGPEQPPGVPAGRQLVWEQQWLLSNAPPAAGHVAPDGTLPRVLPSIVVAVPPPPVVVAGGVGPLRPQQPQQQALELVNLPLEADGRRPMLMYISRTNCGW